MSYVLFLGFTSIIYKISPTIRISLDNTFLDEFEIDIRKTLENNSVNDNTYFSIKNPNWIKFDKTHSKLNPKPIFKSFKNNDINFLDLNDSVFTRVLEINKNFIDSNFNHNLLIEIFNNDNNYTNGFITKNTLISCKIVYLIPKTVLLDLVNFFETIDNDQFDQRKKTNLDVYQLKKSYQTRKNLFDLTKNWSTDIRWHRNIDNLPTDLYISTWVGGDGYFKIPFNNEQISYNKNTIKNYTTNEMLLYSLVNKYKQYENQRSNS